MDDQTALKFIEHLLFLKQAKPLSDTEKAIFCGTWNGLKFKEIAGQISQQENLPISNEEEIRKIGAKLWGCIDNLWELQPSQKVTKYTVKGIVEQQWKLKEEQRSQKSQTPPPPIIDASPEQPSLGEQPSAIANLDPQDSNIRPAPASAEPQQPTSLQLASDPNFVGRESAIAELNTLINQGAKVILIHAKGGVGKTTLAQKYLQQRFGSYIEFPIAKEPQNITSVESLIEERLKQLGEEPGREFGVSLDRLKRKLQTERIGVLIDNLEPALDGNGKIIEPHRRYVELLRVLAEPTVQSITLITSRECLRESAVTIRLYRLEGLDLPAWQEFFNNRIKPSLSPPASGGGNLAPLLVEGDGGGQIVELSPALTAMHKAYGGNAKAMEILSSAIIQDYKGNIEACCQEIQEDLLILGELEDLVTYQFNRLQQLNPDAYKLLCRMGCYRYQDVPTVPIEGLFCMLWDIPEAQQRRVVKALRDRSLVEFKNGEYWLHPMIRAEAIRRLKESEDWGKANRKAAEFWKESVTTIETVEDLRKAFEAFPHYVDIEDFEQAASVIAQERSNKWEYRETLVSLFYRLGLSEKIHTISSFINKIPQTSFLARVRIYEGLGDFYWLTGCTTKSLESYETSRNIAQEENFKNNELHEFLALLNIGLVKLGLWEIEEAEKYFAELELMFLQRNASEGQLIWCRFCLAYSQACLGFKNKSSDLAEKIYNEILTERWNLYKVCDLWITGYSFLFIGLTYKILGDNQKSFEMYTKAIEFAEESDYTLVKAKALDGFAQLYREEENFKKALSYHSEAIELLDKSGEKCDIAEAYYQLGLTYQKMDAAQQSQENFDKSIQLFREMEAPKQVEKVEQAMKFGG